MTQWPEDAITKEEEVKGWKGWTKITNIQTGSRRYRSPGGTVISVNEWIKIKPKWESQGYIPEEELKPVGDRILPGFYTSEQVADASKKPPVHPERQTPPPPKQATDESTRMQWQQQTSFDDADHPILGTVKEIAEKIPEPEKASNRSYGANPSEKEIADGLTSMILFAAVIIAMLTNLESLAAWNKPTVDQATLPFIRIAKKHGWLNSATARVVSEGDDWAQLGKGLATMAIPVIMEIQFKHQQKMEEIRLKNQGAPVTNPTAQRPAQGYIRQNAAMQNGHQQKSDEAAWAMNPNVRPGGAPTPIIRYDNAG